MEGCFCFFLLLALPITSCSYVLLVLQLFALGALGVGGVSLCAAEQALKNHRQSYVVLLGSVDICRLLVCK